MTALWPAGTPGPHVFVESLDAPSLDDDDLHHLTKALRMRSGDPLTISDGAGSWRAARLAESGSIEPVGEVVTVDAHSPSATVAFSLVKGQKPELVIQKLTELGIDRIVVLDAERSVVKWDESKADRALGRWRRIIREAAMQSHRVRLPELAGPVRAADWIAANGVAVAHFGGASIDGSHRSVAIGPEGGWSPHELDSAHTLVTLGNTVLRAETAAIAAGTLLSAAAVTPPTDVV